MTTEYKGADQQIDGDLGVVGTTAIGNSAAAGLVSGTQRFVDVSQTITDFTATNSWRLFGTRFIVDPGADFPSAVATGSFAQLTIPVTNTFNFGTLLPSNSISQHFGSGALGTNLAHNITATLNGTGTIGTNTAVSQQALAAIGSAGTITNNYGRVVVSGNQSAASTVINNFPDVYRSPRLDGPVTNHRAQYFEDQSAGGGGYDRYSEGGTEYHEGDLGLGIAIPLSKLHVNGSLTVKRVGSAVDYNVTSTDYMVSITDTSAPRAVQLPSCASVGNGKRFEVKDASNAAGTNNITINPAGADTIDGAASLAIAVNSGRAILTSDGVSNWEVS